MRPRIERKHFSLKLAHMSLAAACMCLSALSTFASDGASRVVIRPEVSRSHREELITRLRLITGLNNLSFDSSASLRLGDTQTTSGSESARRLLAEAVAGPNVIVLEDASSRSDVAFCRVVRGRWVRGESNKPPAFVVLIDFTDFHQLSGDAEARAAFDVGWGLLHELDHVVKDSEDARAIKPSASVKSTSIGCVSRLVYRSALRLLLQSHLSQGRLKLQRAVCSSFL